MREYRAERARRKEALLRQVRREKAALYRAVKAAEEEKKQKAAAAFATAPRGLKRAEAELTGLIMVLGLLTGLCAGAFSSWLWEL